MRRLASAVVPALSIVGIAVYTLSCVLAPAAWSPDGKSIAFLLSTLKPEQRDKSHQIWIASTETGKAKLLAESGDGLGQPSWSPDGKWIAWLAGGEVVLWDAAKGERRVIEKLDAFESDDRLMYSLGRFCWALDSTFFVGTVLRPGAGDAKERAVVKRYDVPSGKSQVLLEKADYSWGEVSPDGKWILAIERLGTGEDDRRVDLLPTGGGEKRALLEEPRVKGVSLFAAWSPDSATIAFSYEEKEEGRGNRTGVLLVSVDGKETRLLKTPSSDANPMVYGWPKGGKGILVALAHKEAAQTEVVWMDPAKGSCETIAEVDGYPFVGALSLSPDHGRLAYYVCGDMHEEMPCLHVRTLADGKDVTVHTSAENAVWFLAGMHSALEQEQGQEAFDRIHHAALAALKEAREAFPDNAALGDLQAKISGMGFENR